MQASRTRPRCWQRQIQPFLLQPGVQRLCRKRLLSCFKRAFKNVFCGIERLARDFPLLGRQLPHVELRERTLAPQHVHAHLFQRIQIVRLFDPLERLRLQLLDLIFDHYAYASNTSTTAG